MKRIIFLETLIKNLNIIIGIYLFINRRDFILDPYINP